MNRFCAVMVMGVLGLGAAVSSGSIVVPWDAGQGKFYLNMPMTTADSPDTTVGVYVNGGTYWRTQANSTPDGEGIWSFVLPNNTAFTSFSVKATYWSAGSWSNGGWAGGFTSYLGKDGSTWDVSHDKIWVTTTGGQSYVRTLSFGQADLQGQTALYFRNVLDNNYYDSAFQLVGAEITATPEPATFGFLTLGILALLRRK